MIYHASTQYPGENPSQPRLARFVQFLVLAAISLNSAWAVDTPPPQCTGLGQLDTIAWFDWEAGLGAWTPRTRDLADPDGFLTADWAVVSDLPDARPGMAAFVANLDVGDCEDDDQSGALMLDSPPIMIPANIGVPRISIFHWFDTEYFWDGGNLKVSVNGGTFSLVPATAIEFNPYNEMLEPAVDSDGDFNSANPLAGQAGFTGQIDDLPTGIWLESRVNLQGIASPGDTIQLRLDFGVDACDGNIGWYVDEVEFYGCSAEVPPSLCGNSLLDEGEQCDDGNGSIGDGCSNFCEIENGWQCTAPGSFDTIGDPGFEAGTPNPSWTESSSNSAGSPICNAQTCMSGTGSGASDGDYWAWFGGVTSPQESSLSQSVVIPTGALGLTFDFEASACDSPADYLEVLVDGSQELKIDGSSSLCGVIGYASQTVDIGPYADGQAHTIRFHSETFSSMGGVTNFFVDNTALPGVPSMCTPIEPSLTLRKVVINDNGGTAVPANWTLSASGPSSFSGLGPQVSSGAGFQPGTYTLSESGGPEGYAATNWVCSGGTQTNADKITLEAGESATCTITNNDISQGFDINGGHSGAWFNPVTSGQGIFIDAVQSEQFMFVSWFTYTDADSAQPNEQRWFTAQGNYSGDTANLILYESLGGQFDDPAKVTTTAVGNVSLRFTSCNQGRMTYQIDDENLQGNFPIVRVIGNSDAVCEQQSGASTQAVDINDGMDGSWFDPVTSGQGFFIDANTDPVNGDFIFVSWFTYGDSTASGQYWLTAQGGFTGSVAEIEVFETTGGSFDDPEPVSTVKVGTMTIDFTDCSNAELTYLLTNLGVEGEISVTRVIPQGSGVCAALDGAE